MKSLLLGIFFAGACAGSQTHYVNVAAVRHDIKDTIAHDPQQRMIVSMGHTTNDSAVIFTQTSNDAPKREETWVRDNGGAWKMTEAKDLAKM